MTDTQMNKQPVTSEMLDVWGHEPGKAFGAALRDGNAALEEGEKPR